MKKKLDSLQRYLDELPTVDESRAQAHQVGCLGPGLAKSTRQPPVAGHFRAWLVTFKKISDLG